MDKLKNLVNAFSGALADMLGSKKFLACMGAVVVAVLRDSLGLDEATAQQVWVALLGYAGAQGIADHGKHRLAPVAPPPAD